MERCDLKRYWSGRRKVWRTASHQDCFPAAAQFSDRHRNMSTAAVAEKSIPWNKGTLIRLIAISLPFAIFGVWLLTLRSSGSSGVKTVTPITAHLVGVIAVFFFGTLAARCLWRLLDKRPGLILSAAGFTDNCSTGSVGFVPWCEVLAVKTYSAPRVGTFLVVILKSPERYTSRLNMLKRALAFMDDIVCGSPITIPSGTLNVPFGELRGIFEAYMAGNVRNA